MSNWEPWTDENLFVLRRRFPRERTDDVARALGRTYSAVAQKAAELGLVKTPEYLASPAAHRWDGRKGEGTRFAAGHATWNKGLKGVVGVQEACRKHHFPRGNKPQTWLPIGSERTTKDGVLERKVSDTGIKTADWRPVHVMTWESVNGAVPTGCVVVFKPGRKTTDPARIVPDAVECITRRDLMLRNTYHRYGPEVAKLVQLRGAITRQINKRSKEQAA